MSEDGNYHAGVSGTIHAILISKRGVEIKLHPDKDGHKSAHQDSETYTCRLDRSVSYLDLMVELAKTAMLNNLTVSLFGHGDDGDDTLEFDELRISNE